MLKNILKAMCLFLPVLLSSCTGKYESYTDIVEVNGTTLFYAAEGCGKPVILLHGNGGSHNGNHTADIHNAKHKKENRKYKEHNAGRFIFGITGFCIYI